MGMGMIGGTPGVGGVPVTGMAHPPPGLRQEISADYYQMSEEQRRRKQMKAAEDMYSIENLGDQWVVKRYGLILTSRKTKEEAEELMKSMKGRKKPMKAKRMSILQRAQKMIGV